MPLPHFTSIKKSYGYSAIFTYCDECCGCNIEESGAIHKNSDLKTIKYVLDKIKNKDIIFDEKLTQKINEIYGSP